MTTDTPPREPGRRRAAERGGGAPECTKTAIVGEPLARRLSPPYRSSSADAADEAELALEAMREIGPGGHFGAEHTQSRDRAAFFSPMISDWRNRESWREAGSPTAFDAVERIVAERLRDFVAPPLEPDRLEALTAIVARRTAEGGAPTDF